MPQSGCSSPIWPPLRGRREAWSTSHQTSFLLLMLCDAMFRHNPTMTPCLWCAYYPTTQTKMMAVTHCKSVKDLWLTTTFKGPFFTVSLKRLYRKQNIDAELNFHRDLKTILLYTRSPSVFRVMPASKGQWRKGPGTPECKRKKD